MSLTPLDGKVALVTGGSRGMGKAIAVRLAREGADIALTYYGNTGQAADTVERIKALGRRGLAIQADSADVQAVPDAVEQALAEFGRLDILVNNAGVGSMGPVGDITVEEFNRVMAINVRGPFLAAQAAAKHLSNGGRIINIGSAVAGRVIFPGMSLYALSKSALSGLTRALSRELGSREITVNQIDPGAIDTDMNPADGPSADAQKAPTSVGRYGEADEIADAVAYLARDEARYATGAFLTVDGGFSA